jgi:hypothetical protein
MQVNVHIDRVVAHDYSVGIGSAAELSATLAMQLADSLAGRMSMQVADFPQPIRSNGRADRETLWTQVTNAITDHLHQSPDLKTARPI